MIGLIFAAALAAQPAPTSQITQSTTLGRTSGTLSWSADDFCAGGGWCRTLPGSMTYDGKPHTLPMTAGRCSYATGWHGRFYADQDFTNGFGGGHPHKGAKPCD